MGDEILQKVVVSWEPRIITNGVDANDYRRTVQSLARWDQWYGAWMELGRHHESLAEEALGEGRSLTAQEAYYRAALAYHFAIFCWVHNLEEYTTGHRKRVECYQKALPGFDPPGERVEIPLEETTMPGYLRRPRGIKRPPVVLFLSGLDSAKEEHHTFENHFLRRGLATLTVDGPGQGEMWFRMKMRVDFEVAARAAIDFLLSRDDVDGSRVGVCGVSLGGYLAARCAALEPRIRAVACCGSLYSPETSPILLHDAFHLQRWLHIWGAKDQEEVREKSRGATLAGIARHIRVPLLVVHGEKDNLIPPQDPYRIYEEATGPKRWVCYPEGNHVCNNIPYKYRPLVADFLAEALR
ncbi:MAG: YqiA/YcfP family alpha/beta fold hydrolase [Armatimonadota bacterium]|nr:YqiA/YcfP family alpha/beta fold hydrolase [Armatimonadota bacterium]